MTTDENYKAKRKFERRVPRGDDQERLVCSDCGFIQYENPKVVVGSVVTFGDRILLCRRAIGPRIGYWTLPAGYMELNEDPETGARREAWEEARAAIQIERLLAVYSIPRISQVQLIYRASLSEPSFEAGPESQEVALFDWSEVPWKEIAFPSVHWALGHYRESRDQESFTPFSNPEGETGVY